ncbi:MAG: hypothetical protein ACK5JS_03130 [Mangrovibacterium sp.]
MACFASSNSEEAYKSVLTGVGATLPKRDAVDARVTAMVLSGKPMTETGIIKDIAEVGGYPELTFDPKDVLKDTDGDGVPDKWEKQHKLDYKNPADGAHDADEDGYTNVEEYINGTNPQKYINYCNFGNNVDTISF